MRRGFVDDGDAKLSERKKSFVYSMVDMVLGSLITTLSPGRAIPTGPLATALLRCAEEKGPADKVRKHLDGQGVTWEGEGDRVGVLVENVGLRRLAGLSY